MSFISWGQWTERKKGKNERQTGWKWWRQVSEGIFDTRTEGTEIFNYVLWRYWHQQKDMSLS